MADAALSWDFAMCASFSTRDPSPFNEKDLDSDAEEFIVNYSQEIPPDTGLTLRILLAEWPPEDPTEMIRSAVHNYFTYRKKLNWQEFRSIMNRGRTSLIIDLVFLVTCLLISR